MWNEAIFVFDTNILLHIYRYHGSAHERLFEILEKFEDRVWLPHQVVMEFRRRRPDVIKDSREIFNKARNEIQKANDVINGLSKNTYKKEDVSKVLRAAQEMANENLKTLEVDHPTNLLHEDPHLERLFRIFEDKVGVPFEAEILKDRIQTAKERTERKSLQDLWMQN